MAVLPGAPGNVGGASYWIPDMTRSPQVVAEQLKFEDPVEQDLSASVEVLNGCGVAGAAGRVADRLKSAGFRLPSRATRRISAMTAAALSRAKATQPACVRIA